MVRHCKIDRKCVDAQEKGSMTNDTPFIGRNVLFTDGNFYCFLKLDVLTHL